MIMLECRGLVKKYQSLVALDHIDLSLESGRIVGLLGPNGSGKTTLIKLATRLIQPTEGEILIAGEKPGTKSKAMISFLPDREFLPEWMTTKQLLKFYQDFYADFRMEMAREMLRNLDISESMALKKMSKGTREKVRLILTMAREAKIYLLDEPIAGVDPAARDFILRTIFQSYAKDALVLLSTHLIADIEPVLNDVVFIKKGTIVLHKGADELKEETGMSVDAYFREVFRC